MLALALLLSATLTDGDCLSCHGDKSLQEGDTASVYIAPDTFDKSVHSPLGCTGCHDGIKEYPHPTGLAKPACATCHEEESRDLAASIHAGKDGPSCVSCHGSPHAITERTDPKSAIAKASLPETCGRCHADPKFQARHGATMAHPVEAYRSSVHGRALLENGKNAASCSDCHGSHKIQPARDPRSPINRWSVPKTCGKCHGDILKVYRMSVHGQAVARGVSGAPVCTDCHGEHAILAPSEPGSLVNATRVSTVTCARCHADERLVQKYNLPFDKVPAFEDSYHGLALRSGRKHVANCASCHGVHNILPSSDSRSTVNAVNLAKTCGRCHPGAGEGVSLGRVHVTAGLASEHPLTRGVRWAYLLIIPLTIGGMLFHNGLDFAVKLVRGVRPAADTAELPRMPRHFRIAHAMTVASFPVLVVTGFALKFPESWWSRPLLTWEAHVAVRGLVHRVAAVVLILSLLYHAVHVLSSRHGRRFLRRIFPQRADATQLVQAVLFNLRLAPSAPRFGVFSYAEKAEYWAYLWGTIVMAVSGFALWFDDFSLRHLPKWLIDVATTVHLYEAILATAAIAVWHFYLVIFDPEVYPMERAWLTGRISAAHLRHHRPRYYRALMRLVSRRRGE